MKYILLALSFLSLVGCQTTVYKNVVIAPDDDMIRDCVVTTPPSKSLYLSANADGRERILIDNISNHLSEEIKCNERLRLIREWKQKQLKLYGDSNGTGSGS